MKRKLIILILIVFSFYKWTACYGYDHFKLKEIIPTHYDKLQEAFLNRQLHVFDKPHPVVQALPDPYDGSAPWPERLQDASLYKGKYYLYFGPTPVLTLYIPYYLLFKENIPTNLAVFIFSFGAFLWLMLFILNLRKIYFTKTPDWIILLILSVLGFSNFIPWLLSRAQVYEVAISSGLFFLTGSIYFFSRALHEKKYLPIFLGSLFSGLALGSRPNMLAATALIILIVYLVLLKRNIFSKIRFSFLLLFPYLSCLFLLALYNYLRFENIFEFGLSYQLHGFNLHNLKPMHINFVIPWLQLYLFQMPKIDSIFPFIHPIVPPSPSYLKPPGLYFIEKTVGIIPTTPFILLIFLPVFYLKSKIFSFISPKKIKEVIIGFPIIEFWFVFISALVGIITISLMWGNTERYVVDCVSYFILAASIIFLYMDNNIKDSNFIKLSRRAALIAGLFSIVCGFYLSITGCCEVIYNWNKDEYSKVEKYSKPVSKIIKFIIGDKGIS